MSYNKVLTLEEIQLMHKNQVAADCWKRAFVEIIAEYEFLKQIWG